MADDINRTGGGGGWIAFAIGALVVAIVVIAGAVLMNGGMMQAPSTDVAVDIDVPRPTLPEAPRVPDLPTPPPVEPPTLPNPQPAAAG